MTKQEKIAHFDPSATISKNGHFIGLPFDENDASIVLLPVPWDATVFYGEGTATAAQNILEASSLLNLYDSDVQDAWKMGIYMRHLDLVWLNRNEELRHLVDSYIDFLESGGHPAQDRQMANALEEINNACFALKTWVYQETSLLLNKGKRVGIVGGDHSVVLGYLETLAQQHGSFGILQIDAQPNLREAYQGFTYSHTSIFNNALKIKEITKLIQVGIRDYGEAEARYAVQSNGRVKVWFDQQIKEEMYGGTNFEKLCKRIISDLPQKVYISFDISGLTPDQCPNTSNPVPGGLQFNEAIFLLKTLAGSGREIIGFDLCETAGMGHEWEGNIAARILYKLCNLMGKSAGIQ